MTAIGPSSISVPSIKQKYALSLKEMVEMFPGGVIIHFLRKGRLYITGCEDNVPYSVDCRSIFGATSVDFLAHNRFTRQRAIFKAKHIVRLLCSHNTIKKVVIVHMYN
jgi:hypothetical protein